jgi:hypothetical protein
MTGIETAALIAAGVGAAASAAGTVMAGQQQAKQSKINAQALDYNAREQRTIADVQAGGADAEAARLSDANRRRLGSAANAAAATGAQFGTGTSLDLMADLAAEASLDEEIVRWRGRQAATSSQRQAGVTDWQAGITAAQGKAQTQAANLTAGANLLTSGARIYGTYG